MAVIDLKNVDVVLRDGLSGVANANDTIAANDPNCTLDGNSVALNTTVTDKVPIGAKFTIANEDGGTIHTVTERTWDSTNGTTNIEFTPVAGANCNANAVLTFLPQELSIVVGEGNASYTEARNIEYRLDRGSLNTTKLGDEVPVEVSLDFDWEYVTSGVAETCTPIDALKRKTGTLAAEWVSSDADDLCAPYAIDVVLKNVPDCAGGVSNANETIVLAKFRYDKLAYDLSKSTISVSGKCNVTEATATRS